MFYFRKKYDKPFIYISAMPRSGSTMLSGLLTIPKASIILSEPGFQRGLFHNLEQFREIPNSNIETLSKYKGDEKKLVNRFYKKVMPSLLKEYPIVGVKECFMQNWKIYENSFDDVRYIILARDPRDVFLSLHDYGRYAEWHKKLWMEKGIQYIADIHNQIWEEQKSIIATRKCFLVKYEDLCIGKVNLDEIKFFLGINNSELGGVDSILKNYQWRQWEIKKHGKDITKNSVYRWKNLDSNSELLDCSMLFGNMMKDYIEYWGYE